MAEDRTAAQGIIPQPSVGHASPPPPAPSSGTLSSPPRGPRTLLLRRSENGFGFTLRHFIVYPPESCCMLPGHERTKIDEPMDTIFVKQVRGNSPAAEAGLRTGDRVVSVDGVPTRGEQYASVVQRIQQAGPWLRLLVVAKEDDILQRYFGETAHNPETNQRPGRFRSPERVLQKQRRSMSMIPGPSPRSRQSWVCSPPGSENQGTGAYRSQEAFKDQPAVKMTSVPNVQRRPLTEARNQDYRQDDRSQRRSLQQDDTYRNPESRFDLYDRTRPESIYSRPSSEQIYDRIKDPIYERVRPDLTGTFSKSLDHQYPVSRAEPQVPIYRPGRRVVTRRASEGSGPPTDHEVSNESSRLSIDSRRDSSPASKDSSLSSYDSNSTLTGNECSDDSVIMTRLRKSFEQKEEFLRRPSHPIGWLLPDEASRLNQNQNQNQGVQREFYARPQKLQRQVWPPNEQSDLNANKGGIKNGKPGNQNVQRVRDIEGEGEERESREGRENGVVEDAQAIRDRFYSSLCDANGQFVKENHFSFGKGDKGNNKCFVTTLSRIHENVGQGQDVRNGTSSLPSSPGPDKKQEKFPVPQGLQIVSRRAKQFESGRLLSDDDEPTSDRTNLYKSELSRLSNKRSVPNVAVRKREFESKAEGVEGRRANHRESKSLDSEKKYLGRGLSGNRIIPVGSKYIHCEPPSSYSQFPDEQGVEMEPVRLRARSNSAESWEAVNGGTTRRGVRHTWQNEPEDLETEARNSKAKRQDSYLQAVRSQLEREPQDKGREDERQITDMSSAPLFSTTILDNVTSGEGQVTLPSVTISPPQPVRPNQLSIPNPLRPLDSSEELNNDHQTNGLLAPGSNATNGVVLRRQKNTQISDEDRATRRVSYLKATWGERMHVDSDLELSDSEPVTQAIRSAHKRWRPPLFPSDITPLLRIFEDVTSASSHRHNHRNSIQSSHGSSIPKDVEPIEREGSLHVKFTVLDGKRSTDRSWKQVWGVLRGPILHFYKDRHSQSPSATSDGDAGQNVDVRCSLVDVADDYTKRKHVLRVANPTAEVLLQTEDAASMALWLRALHKHAAAEKPSDANTSTSKQQAVPQTPGPTTPSAGQGGQRLSPLPSHKGIRKLTSFRNRSPTGQSPVNKTRKPSQTVDPLPSPKSKTWKGRVAKQLRRMHGQAGSPSSPTAQLPPEGATFKVPLELCPVSSFSEFVPLIVEMCTSIVEARGLEVIGIYRVPGNTAAISQLTESVNKGFESINLQDPRWSDVNVISSLLKSFFRQLPDSLLTADLYPMFIDADKIEDPQRRMTTIRKLLRDLPEHHFETLKYLMFHLKRVVEHSEINKMEAKNLAIVFGPTLVRASGSRDNMVTMVTDMSHQCRIVESLLNNVDWFFCEEDLDDLSRLSVNLSLPADGSEVEASNNHSLLLNNIQKVEANRKIQRRRKGHEEHESEEHEEEKTKTKSEPEPLVRQSMALNERQCSVSEIVMMHETKSQSNHTPDRQDRNNLVNSANSSPLNGTISSRSQQQFSTTSSSLDSPRLPEVSSGSLDTVSTISNASNETKQSGNDEVIRTYAGLSATTQERIRRFEQETKAMLQRDQYRHRKEAEKREGDRRRIEMEWQLAKREMENDDILDGMVESTVSSPYLADRLANLSDRLAERSGDSDRGRSKSSTRLTPMSIAVQQQPSANQKAHASSQLSSIIGEKINNGVVKKFKTDKEPSMESLVPTRYGSLDSLHEVHMSHTSPSPSHHTRGIPGDISDDGSDLLTSLTSTFDRKWKSLVNPSSLVVASSECTSGETSAVEKKSNREKVDRQDSRTTEVYRDPSLHRSVGEKGHLMRARSDPQEKLQSSPLLKPSEKPKREPPTPNNDLNLRHAVDTSTAGTDSSDGGSLLDATEKDEHPKMETPKTKHLEIKDEVPGPPSDSNQPQETERKSLDSSYSNKLQKFESLSQATNESRSRLKRSESLNKRTETASSKLKRSESLNKHSDRLASPTNGKLKRSESLNKHAERSESPNTKLKRSESLTKTEKTECNISKRRQSVRKESATKLKRKNGMPERSIKRRHTVGGTKDFDKVHWLDNKLQSENEKVIKTDSKPKKSQLRTSSPDLSSNRVNVADTSFLIEVSFRGPSNVVFNVTNARPQSLPDANLASKVFKVPLESHV
ncbi:uncharacterized protein RhoGAP19D isoform X2 [Fopius arisanus]|uniref:Uncharacterized protein RhoGAP19D isoform X2 n=1 Tax=Fopius arisanus TaxID=64838 RepID=A0A9R1T0Q5_9HYME|nr:PREDICTED: uncharacterized protein LOC105264979 isoform X2 [Fopius arisanus]